MRVYSRNSDLEALSNGRQNLFVLFLANKGDGQTLGTKTARTTDAMQVGVGITRHVVVDSQVNSLNVDTTTKHVGGNANALIELLELLVTLDTTWLSASGKQRRSLEA